MKRTDLFYESAVISGRIKASDVHEGELYGTRYIEATVAEDTDGIAAGRYITLFTERGDVCSCLTEFLRGMVPGGSVLVAGLGNEDISPDSLGAKSLAYIPATAHLSEHSDFRDLGLRSVYVLGAGVTGKTGIESSRSIACTARCGGAGSVIAIDSLACADIGRLCNTIQLTDTGISPGSGVGNDRQAVNHGTLGIPVVAIGVPTVIDLGTLTNSDSADGLMVTPRNIDSVIRKFSEIIGIAVSRALNPNLTEAEIRSLIIR